MVKATFFISALALLAGVEACKRTCTPTKDKGGVCTYSCTKMCSDLGAKEARDEFLSNLQSAGHKCSASGSSGVKCTKNSSFGSCYDHHWSCGSGC